MPLRVRVPRIGPPAGGGGPAGISGAGAGLLPLAGSGAARLTLSAAGSGALPLGGAGAGVVAAVPGISGAGAGLLPLAGSGAARLALSAAGSGALPLGGAGAGVVAAVPGISGAGAGLLPLAGSGAARLALSAAGSGALPLGGAGAGLLDMRATGTALLPLGGAGAVQLGQAVALPAVIVLVRLRLVRPVQASLALTRLVVAHLAIEGKRMSVFTLTAGSAALIKVTFRTEGGAPITDAGGVVLRAKPPGAGAVRTYTVSPGDLPGEWRGTILFDVPGRWWVEGLCATPSPEVSAPLIVEVRAAAAA
jgi:hypothetical protein